jgi:hypothetical protein
MTKYMFQGSQFGENFSTARRTFIRLGTFSIVMTWVREDMLLGREQEFC